VSFGKKTCAEKEGKFGNPNPWKKGLGPGKRNSCNSCNGLKSTQLRVCLGICIVFNPVKKGSREKHATERE